MTSRGQQNSAIQSITSILRCDGEVTLKRQLMLVACGYFAVAAIEILGHWLIAQPACRVLFRVYLLHTPSGGVSIVPDFLFPAGILGWWNGQVTKTVPIRRAVAFALPLAAGTVALLPIYAWVMGGEGIWWWPKGGILVGHFLAVEFFFAAILVWGLTVSFRK